MFKLLDANKLNKILEKMKNHASFFFDLKNLEPK